VAAFLPADVGLRLNQGGFVTKEVSGEQLLTCPLRC